MKEMIKEILHEDTQTTSNSCDNKKEKFEIIGV